MATSLPSPAAFLQLHEQQDAIQHLSPNRRPSSYCAQLSTIRTPQLPPLCSVRRRLEGGVTRRTLSAIPAVRICRVRISPHLNFDGLAGVGPVQSQSGPGHTPQVAAFRLKTALRTVARRISLHTRQRQFQSRSTRRLVSQSLLFPQQTGRRGLKRTSLPSLRCAADPGCLPVLFVCLFVSLRGRHHFR